MRSPAFRLSFELSESAFPEQLWCDRYLYCIKKTYAYERVKHLKPAQFKRFWGVTHETFDQMVEIVRCANDPFDDESNKVIANSYGMELNFQISPAFTLGGWVGFTQAIADDLSGNPEANIFNYAATLAFPDLGKEGNLGGIVIGQPPKVIDNDFNVGRREYKDKDSSLHLEAFYIFRATDNIAITPGLLVIINPEHDKNNNTVYVGTIRTTFTFWAGLNNGLRCFLPVRLKLLE